MNDKSKADSSVPPAPGSPQDKPAGAPGDRTVFRSTSSVQGTAQGPGNAVAQDRTVDATRMARPGSPQGKPAESGGDHTVSRPATPAQSTGPARGNPVAQGQPADATRIKSAGVAARTPGQVPRQPSAGTDATRMRQAPPAAQGSPNPTRVREQARPASVGREQQVGAVQEETALKGRFVLEKVIGVGGMGVVYKAIDKLKVEAHDREPHVAIKVLSDEFKSHPESFIALQRESRKTQRLAHPNVVKVYDFDRDGDTVFMTMEYMEGRPLDQIIKQYSSTGLPRDDVWNILNGLCSALIYAHAEKIVHSDFKPGNIFITDAGHAKIFDFGIARAVASVDRQTGKHQDRTVFDAGSLGALTPAYASLEMLLGKEPDIRDDLFALGCIAYEMLTGEHPYKRIPADEALKSRMKPARIQGIKARQWKAIEKSLAFRREDRLASVEEFYQLIQPKRRSLALWFVLAVLATASATVYFVLDNARPPPPAAEIQLDEIEFKIRYDLFREKIEKLVADPRFSPDWESSLRDEVNGMQALLGERRDAWLVAMRETIYGLYQKKFLELLQAKSFPRAGEILNNAAHYTDDPKWIGEQKQRLAELERQEAERQSAARAERQRVTEVRDAQAKVEERRNDLFDLALRNVNQQLQCQGQLNMRDFGVAVEKLRTTDAQRYEKLESNIIVKLSECIAHVGKTQPERALEAKNYALRIFNNNRFIAAINIIPRDVCDRSIAGLGARGDRAVCQDKLADGGTGPTLVVIPGGKGVSAFAIGKYEVSVREFNHYCKASGACGPVAGQDESLPIVNVSVNQANGYIRWLSSTTQQKYRLPTRIEWMYAANATSQSHDPNRNCQLNSRGIEKGGALVRMNTGMQNGWGLVNYLGNAREWVYDQSRSLLAVGGSFDDPMERCDVGAMSAHTGQADKRTGFRVVRELVR